MTQRVHYIAGASGVGTSTNARELHQEWSSEPDARPVCVIATDVVRAQLRAVVERDAHPDLWGESFNLPASDGDTVRDGVSIDAFLRQCAPIMRAVEAGVEYALTEGWDVIVEGVHLVPDLVELAAGDALDVTFELIVVPDADEHVARFRSRDVASNGGRSASHYEANLDRVRAIQDELVERWQALESGA
ncbi:MAG: ATP-cone domain protein [Thermoleophilia bacterium]|nr:ATP-cone domain protein [Thermoleophilia bacterium]